MTRATTQLSRLLTQLIAYPKQCFESNAQKNSASFSYIQKKNKTNPLRKANAIINVTPLQDNGIIYKISLALDQILSPHSHARCTAKQLVIPLAASHQHHWYPMQPPRPPRRHLLRVQQRPRHLLLLAGFLLVHHHHEL